MKQIMNARYIALSGIFLTALLSGCASIVNGTNQIVSVETKLAGQAVSGVVCKLENSKGVFYVTTPGTVTLLRAYGDLSVKCDKENIDSGLASVKSHTKGMAFGNILFGGVIGVAVDAGTGAAYDYPSLITVAMGESTQLPLAVLPAQAKADAQVAAPAASTGVK